MNRITINWDGETVGFMEDPMPDMWYLEGKWFPNDSPRTIEFLKLTQNLNLQESIEFGSDVWVELIEEGKSIAKATILSPPSETIFVRRSLPTEPKRKWYRFWLKS